MLAGAVAATPAAAAWGQQFSLSKDGQNASQARVAVDDSRAVFVWVRPVSGHQLVQARQRSAVTGALSPIQDISPAGEDASQPEVAIDVDGDAVFTWQRSDATNTRIQARARTFSSGALTAVQDLSDAGENAISPQVAVDVDGDAVFVWRRFDGTNHRIQARTRSGAGVLGAVEDVSAAGENGAEPRVAVDHDLNAVAAWQRDIVIDRVAGAVGP